jgi:hypothetical protein
LAKKNKKKDRHYKNQKEEQTLQRTKKTDITMTKKKDRHYNDQKEGQTLQ